MSSPQVALLMGSKNDLPKLQSCVDALIEFDVPHTVRVMSAHRTPAEVTEFSSNARDNGLKVIIAAAGCAAHLAGVVAAHTTLPVIGIPVEGGPFKGMDALLATVQMPGGIPVATVAIGKAGAKNAAYLAAQIIGVADTALGEKLIVERRESADAVVAKDKALQEKLASR